MKKIIIKENILKYQEMDELEQRLVFGVQLILGVFYFCLEVERRLEIGDRFFISVFVFDGVVFEIINCCLVRIYYLILCYYFIWLNEIIFVVDIEGGVRDMFLMQIGLCWVVQVMLGFVWVFFFEKVIGLMVFEQFYMFGQIGLVFFVGVVQFFMYVLLVLIVNGEFIDVCSFGLFIVCVERWNGWLVMFGFLFLVVIEMFCYVFVFY